MPALAPEQQRVQRHQELPPPPPAAAAADKPIEGVCHRRNVKCGWKKIDFVLRMVRRGTVDDAMAQLSANPKRAALFVKHAVANARGNAIFAGADPARLVVAEAFVTKGQYKKRLAIMGRGYSSIKLTRYSHLNVRVVQADEAQLAALALRRPRRTVAPIMVRMQGRRTARRAGGSTGGGWGGGNSGGGERRQAA